MATQPQHNPNHPPQPQKQPVEPELDPTPPSPPDNDLHDSPPANPMDASNSLQADSQALEQSLEPVPRTGLLTSARKSQADSAEATSGSTAVAGTHHTNVG